MTTPSGLARELACMASVVLPAAKSTGPRAARGSDLHAFIKNLSTKGPKEALDECPDEWRKAAESIDFSRLPALDPESCVVEIAIAWNPETGAARELGRNGEVEHDDLAALALPGELVGISDYIALTPSDVVVFDWKFGYSSIERAEVNRQLGAYACMAAALYGRERATVSIARIFDDGSVWTDTAELDEMALDGHRARIRRHMRNAEEAKAAYRSSGIIPTPVEGGHCRYCPALPFCPAKVALLLSTFSDGEKQPAEMARLPEPLTHDIVASLWPKLQQAEKLIEKLKENAKDFARAFGPVQLPNGNMLAEGESQRDAIDVGYGREVLEARFGPERVAKAIESKLTKKALGEMLTENSSHGKKAKLERDVMAELADAGALRSYTIRSVEELKPTSKRLKAANE